MKSEPPIDVSVDTFHVLNLCNVNFYIDGETRKEIESFLKQAEKPWEFIIVSDLAGAEVTVIVDAVNIIYSSEPSQRAAEQAMSRALNAELPPE